MRRKHFLHFLHSSRDNSCWNSGVLSRKRQTLPFRSPELRYHARQVFCPLNLKFNPHIRQSPSFPVTAGFTGISGKSMLRSSRLSRYSSQKFHTSRCRGYWSFAQTGLPRSCLMWPKCHSLLKKCWRMRDRRRVGSRQRSLSFLSFFSRCERPLLAGKLIDNQHCKRHRKKLTREFNLHSLTIHVTSQPKTSF